MMVTTSSDRVQLIDRGSLMHPGCCALCGSGNCDEGYVDPSIYFDYEGNVYFCWNCAMQIAAVIGCLSADEHSHIRELLEQVTQRAINAEKELANATERLDNYDALMLRALIVSDDSADDSSSDAPEVQSEVESGEPAVSSSPVNDSDDGEPVVKESTASVRRRKPSRPERSDSDTEGLSI